MHLQQKMIATVYIRTSTILWIQCDFRATEIAGEEVDEAATMEVVMVCLYV